MNEIQTDRRIEIEQSDWYKSLADDCRAILVEAEFESRFVLVMGYHSVGRRIVEDADYQKHAQGNGRLLQGLAKLIERSERSLYYAIQLYKKFPDPDRLPEGKNISMNKLITKYLPEPQETEDDRHIPSITAEVALDRFENAARYILENYPEWADAMKQRFWDLQRGEWK